MTEALIALLASILIFGVFLLKLASRERLRRLQKQWDAAGSDVVVLHILDRSRQCPNPSPFSIKLETWLRMNNIK